MGLRLEDRLEFVMDWGRGSNVSLAVSASCSHQVSTTRFIEETISST